LVNYKQRKEHKCIYNAGKTHMRNGALEGFKVFEISQLSNAVDQEDVPGTDVSVDKSEAVEKRKR
jgi:hypothetical protein